MALVPRYQPQAAPQTGGTPLQHIGADPAAFGAGLGQALQGAGQTLGQVAQDLHVHALQLQDQDNQIDKNNATLAFTQQMTGLLNEGDNAFYNLREKSAYDAFGGAQKQVEELRQQVRGTLTNPKAAQLFDNDTRRMTAMQFESMARYASSQRRVWIDKSDDASVDNAVKMAGQAKNADEFALANDTLQDAVSNKAVHNGWAPEVTNDYFAKQRSALYEVHARTLATDNPTAGLDFARESQKSGMFYGDTGPKIVATLTEMSRPDMAQRAADAVTAGLVAPNNLTPEQMFNTVIVPHGEHGKAGQVSSEGAVGRGQLLPATAAWMANTDPELLKAGVKFNPKNPQDVYKLTHDDAFNAQFGVAYVRYLNSRYQGDPLLTGMGYVAGPGNVDALVKKYGDPRQVGYEAWLNRIPTTGTGAMPRSKAYGERVMAALNSGSVQTRASIMGKLPDADAQLQGMGMDYRTTQLARSVVRQRLQDETLAATAQNSSAMQTAIGMLAGDGTHNVPLATLLKDPGFQDAWSSLTGQQRLSLTSTDQRLSNDVTPDRADNYARLQFMAHNSTHEFLKENLDETDLTTRQRQSLYGLKATIAAKPGAQVKNPVLPKVLGDPRIKTALMQVGILDDKGKVADREQYNNFGGRLLGVMEQYNDLHPGKSMPVEEAVKAANAFFVKTAPTSQFLFGKLKIPGTHEDGHMEYKSGSVPSAIQGMPIDDYSQVKQILQKRYPGQNITAPMVYNAWKQAGGHS